MRACRENGSQKAATTTVEKELDVIDCANNKMITMTQHSFFAKFVKQEDVNFRMLKGEVQPTSDEASQPLLKVKDWPQEEHFSVRMVRHNQVRT